MHAVNNHGLVLEQKLDGHLELSGQEQDLQVGEGIAVLSEVFFAKVNGQLGLKVLKSQIVAVRRGERVFDARLTREHDRIEFEPEEVVDVVQDFLKRVVVTA